MRILHYSLGMPPYRSGGLTKYSVDIMDEQAKENDVALLFPGRYTLINNQRIKYEGRKNNISIYELINPLPVSLLGGVIEPKEFMKNGDLEVYINFLKSYSPDIIHLHTLMGLHKEFVIAAKELGIKIVFTTHDYYGICPKVNLLDYKGNICVNYEEGQKCCKCNKNGYSLSLIRLMQSKTYRTLKQSSIVKRLRRLKKNKYSKQDTYNKGDDISIVDVDKAPDYKRLREYYLQILRYIDEVYYNSNLAMGIYNDYLKNKGKVVNITHRDIRDNRIKKDFIHEELRITYLGPMSPYKGYNLLNNSITKLRKKGCTNIIFNIYGDDSDSRNEIEKNTFVNGRYDSKDLVRIFDDTDLLIVPSIWKETFGFILLEGYSYGVPCILTDNVGAKDIIKQSETGFIIKANENDMCNIIETIYNDRSKLEYINENILKSSFKIDIQSHLLELYNEYKI